MHAVEPSTLHAYNKIDLVGCMETKVLENGVLLT